MKKNALTDQLAIILTDLACEAQNTFYGGATVRNYGGKLPLGPYIERILILIQQLPASDLFVRDMGAAASKHLDKMIIEALEGE